MLNRQLFESLHLVFGSETEYIERAMKSESRIDALRMKIVGEWLDAPYVVALDYDAIRRCYDGV